MEYSAWITLAAVLVALAMGGGEILKKRGFAPLKHPVFFTPGLVLVGGIQKKRWV